MDKEKRVRWVYYLRPDDEPKPDKATADLIKRMHHWLKWADNNLGNSDFVAPIYEATEFNSVIAKADAWLKENEDG